MSRDMSITHVYEEANQGQWHKVLAAWAHDPDFAQACSRFQKPSSGWTFLHQAAYFGHESACRELIRFGAAVDALSAKGEAAADVAEQRTYSALGTLLRRAAEGAQSLWTAPKNVGIFPSSCLWDEARERRATQSMQVAYAGGVAAIPEGSRYFVDSFERTLVGWHGTYDPPCGMDGESMIEE